MGLLEVVGTLQQVHCSRRRLLRRGLEFHVCTINKSAHTKKVWKRIVCTLYMNIHTYIHRFVSLFNDISNFVGYFLQRPLCRSTETVVFNT